MGANGAKTVILMYHPPLYYEGELNTPGRNYIEL